MSTPPTPVAEYETVWSSSASPKATATFAAQAGDVLVAYVVAEDAGAPNINVSGGSLTWATQPGSASGTQVQAWTAVVDAAKSMSVSFAEASNTNLYWGGNVLHFRGSAGVGVAAAGSGAGAPALNLVTTQDNSAVVVVSGDWNAADGTTRTWRTGAGAFTERTYFRDSARYAVYGGFHADAGAAGTKTVGLTVPAGQSFDIAAIEVKGTAAAAGTPVALAGSGSAASTGSGSAQVTTTAGGSGSGSTVAAGSATVGVAASGTGTAASTVSGSAAVTAKAAGTGQASSAASGTTVVHVAAAGTGSATASATGSTGMTGVHLAGTGSASSAASGQAAVTVRAAGNGSATSAAGGSIADLTPAVQLAGSGAASTVGSGSALVRTTTAGLAAAAAQASGELLVHVLAGGAGSTVNEATGSAGSLASLRNVTLTVTGPRGSELAATGPTGSPLAVAGPRATTVLTATGPRS